MFRTSIPAVGLAMLVALALVACSSEPEPRPYLGHWESLYRGRGGAANGLVFRADSTMDRMTFYAHDFRYSIEGDSVRCVSLMPDSLWPEGDTVPPVVVNHFAISGDTLVQSDAKRTEWLVRDGGPHSASSPLVGTWRVVNSSASSLNQGFSRFGADSLLQVRIPAAVLRGTYQVQADFEDTIRPDSICMYLPTDTSRCVVTWRADTLVLTRTFKNGTFSFEYLHAGDSSWYREINP